MSRARLALWNMRVAEQETVRSRTASAEEMERLEHRKYPRPRPSVLCVQCISLLSLSFSLPAQISQPDAQPPANQKTIFERAVEMYESKKYSTALLAFQEAGAAGNTEAAAYLGVMYSEGQGTPVDSPEAMKWLAKAAAAGDSQAMCNIGILYFRGEGIPQRLDLARQWFRDAAVAGNSQAMFNIGALYRDGIGGPADFNEAIKWFFKATIEMNDKAMNSLGAMYRSGQGVNIDNAEAARWFRKAADLGNQSAMYNLGTLYQLGLGVPLDEEEGRKWLAKAAEERAPDDSYAPRPPRKAATPMAQ